IPANREALAGRVGGELGLRNLLHTDLLLSDFSASSSAVLGSSSPRGWTAHPRARPGRKSSRNPNAADRGYVRSYVSLFYSVATHIRERNTGNLQAQIKSEIASSAALRTSAGGCDASIVLNRSGSCSASPR